LLHWFLVQVAAGVLDALLEASQADDSLFQVDFMTQLGRFRQMAGVGWRAAFFV
jgi:hypothetical protein